MYARPRLFPSPYNALSQHPLARQAAEQLLQDMRLYMAAHPDSELHRRGKMFGVLITEDTDGELRTLRAFSAMLDGSYQHPGFVPPVYAIPRDLIGHDADDSRRKQDWVFDQFRFLNAQGEEKGLKELFANAAQLRDWDGRPFRIPSGAGECCAPKLLQEAYRQGLKPLCMAELWIGASPRDELRIEGHYYPACNGKCKPILRHMLQGLTVEEAPSVQASRELAAQTRILYEDDYLLVASKPAGLLTVLGANSDEQSLQGYLGLTPAHRLDQDTSGIVVCAKQADILPALQQLFLRRDIHKHYIARLEHAPAEREGIISLPMRPDPLDRPRQVVDYVHGKEAITRWHCHDDDPCVVDLYPATGRTHQLRVHCAHPDGLGSPIVGDRLYGTAAQRLMLHAAAIQFPHPVTGEELQFVEPFTAAF